MRKMHGSREFLNLPGHHTVAAIVAEIEDTSTWQPGKGRKPDKELTRYTAHPHTTFTISDCSTNIALEIEIDSEDKYNNTLYKLDTLVDAISQLRHGVVMERHRYIERASHIPKNREYGMENPLDVSD